MGMKARIRRIVAERRLLIGYFVVGGLLGEVFDGRGISTAFTSMLAVSIFVGLVITAVAAVDAALDGGMQLLRVRRGTATARDIAFSETNLGLAVKLALVALLIGLLSVAALLRR